MTYYFDMDGVLVHFDETASISKPWFTLGSGYFRTAPENPSAVEAFKLLSMLPEHDVAVLTRVWFDLPPGPFLEALLDETTHDKRAWCDVHLDFRATADWSSADMQQKFLHTRQTLDKTEPLLTIPERDRYTHVLIDDDPTILWHWVQHGGSGVQYIQQDRNVPVWTGPVIRDTMSVPHIIRQLTNLPMNRR